MQSLTLNPLHEISGKVEPPGSKSISNRVLPLAALAKGTTTIRNLLHSDDVQHMQNALQQIGIPFELADNNLKVTGLGTPFHSATLQNIFLGNSGTATRILTALLAGSYGEYIVDGIPRMHERPIGDLIQALIPLAGNTCIEYLQNPGYPPLKLLANGLAGGKTTIKGNISSQFLTGLLMAMPLCRNSVEVKVDGILVSQPYVELTLQMMRDFGVTVTHDNYTCFYLETPSAYISPREYLVEADASSASYFLAAGSIAGEIEVLGIGEKSLQGEAQFAQVLKRMGAQVTVGPQSIKVRKGELRGIDVDMDKMSDTGMTLAMVALFAKGRTTIRNIGNWRVKETDRIAAMATELRKVGAQVEEGLGFLIIDPPQTFLPATINTYDDHRMAMCFSLAAFGGESITILDPQCTSKTYPNYFTEFQKRVR